MLFATPELDNRERDALEHVEDLNACDGLERD